MNTCEFGHRVETLNDFFGHCRACDETRWFYNMMRTEPSTQEFKELSDWKYENLYKFERKI